MANDIERWAFSFDGEALGQGDFTSREEALVAAAEQAKDDGVVPGGHLYIDRLVHPGASLVHYLDKGLVLDADQVVHEIIGDLVGLSEDFTASTDDVEDLAARLRHAIESWVQEREPFSDWLVVDNRPTDEWCYFWDGERVRPFREFQQWKEQQT